MNNIHLINICSVWVILTDYFKSEVNNMKVGRTERHIINKNHKLFNIIDSYSFKSKNLYNFANYAIRQEFINNGKYKNYNTLAKELKTHESYKEIGSGSGQQTLKLLDQNWKSFFASIKDWNKNPHKYRGRPKLPNYLDKEDGRYVFVLTNRQSKIRDGYLYFGFKPLKQFNGLIKTNVVDKHMQTRFIPKSDHYVLEIVYQREIEEIQSKNEKIIGIDLGVSRFAAIQNNIGMKPIAINGGDVKAFNNYYNKQMAKYKSIAETVNGQKWTNRLQKLTNKRNNKIENFLHTSSKYIVDYCIENNIDTVVIGHNDGWKQNINIGKKNNQTFVGIPFSRFIQKLEYKCQDNGIECISVEESYTSKASFIDSDNIPIYKKGSDKKYKFSGNRRKRGLYVSKDKILINADVNGASNIMLKKFPDAFKDKSSIGCHPDIINVI